MKLLILGASGGCGRWVVRLAAEQGHDVTAMVRRTATPDAPAGVTVFCAPVTSVSPTRICTRWSRRSGRVRSTGRPSDRCRW